MANKTTYNVSLDIGGRVDQSLNKSVDKVNQKLDGFSKAAKFAAGAATAAFTAIKVKDAIEDITSKSIDFESSMADVAKVVNGLKDSNGKLTKSYYDMSDSILDLSTNIPMTANAISEITAAAGQADIAKKDLIDFTDTAAKMGVAFDTTAEQAGEWEAAWRKSFDLDQKGVKSLADKINYLGNTSTENALKLSDVVTRIGSLGKTAGLSAEGVAAIAASMTKVNSEISATGIKNMLVTLTAGNSATKKQQGILKTLNLDAKQLAKTMQTDAQGAIITVLERIKQLPKAEQAATLSSYFGKESLASIAPLLSNLDNLKKQFNKVGDASLYAGSMESEYASRAATKANDLILAKNKIAKAEIQLGNNALPLIGEGAEVIGSISDQFSGFVEYNAPAFENAVRNIKGELQDFAPVAIKTFNEVKDVADDFWDTFSDIGEWFKKNPEVVSAAIGGIGGAITTYKVSEGVKGVTKSFKSLVPLLSNPWALAIGAVGTAIGAIALSIYETDQRLKKANLAEHFGDISLSLDDLDKVAGYIIRTDKIGKLEEAISAFDAMDKLNDSISDAVENINKMNWKVSIGMKLSKDDRSDYLQSIQSFVKETQDLILQKQYAISLNLKVFTNDNALGDAIRSGFDTFYQSSYQTAIELGNKLNKAVNDAFSDNLLTIDEVKEISELQQQIAEMAQKLAGSEFDAKLDVLNLKYSGANLDPVSFQNLQKEIGEQQAAAVAKLDDGLTKAISSAKIRLQSDPKYTEKEYKRDVDSFQKNYLDQITELSTKATDFQLDTIMQQYDSELSDAIPKYKEKLNKYLKETFSDEEWKYTPGIMTFSIFDQANSPFKSSDLDKGTRKALKDLYKKMEPSIEEMEKTKKKYEEMGMDVPESISKGLSNAYLIGALTRDSEAVDTVVSDAILNSDSYTQMVTASVKAGIKVPTVLSDAINKNAYKVEDAIFNMWNKVDIGGNNIFDDKKLPINNNKIYDKNGKIKAPFSDKYINDQLGGHADGGIFTVPHIAQFAEDGPEAAIPLDGSANAINIWRKSGQLLGVMDQDGYSSGNVNSITPSKAYERLSNPGSTNNIDNTDNSGFHIHQKIIFQGKVNKDEVMKGITMSQSEFDRLYNNYKTRKKRVSMRR